VKQDLKTKNITIPLRIVFRDDHIWIAYQMQMLHGYWPQYYDTVTPGIMDAKSRYYKFESYENSTIYQLEDFSDWISDYKNGEVREFLRS